MVKRKWLACEIPQLGANSGEGYVTISYADEGVDKGLCIVAYMGFRRHKIGKEPMSYGWRILEPFPDLLMNAISCAMNLMPPYVFADWLEENADTIQPLIINWNRTGMGSAEDWNRVLHELRRFANPEPVAASRDEGEKDVGGGQQCHECGDMGYAIHPENGWNRNARRCSRGCAVRCSICSNPDCDNPGGQH